VKSRKLLHAFGISGKLSRIWVYPKQTLRQGCGYKYFWGREEISRHTGVEAEIEKEEKPIMDLLLSKLPPSATWLKHTRLNTPHCSEIYKDRAFIPKTPPLKIEECSWSINPLCPAAQILTYGQKHPPGDSRKFQCLEEPPLSPPGS
jgi:hypothetical protein